MQFRKRMKMDLSDFEFLQEIQARLGSKLRVQDLEPKLADLLKVIELKYKIKDESEKEKVFWNLVEELVNEELEKKQHEEDRESGQQKRDSSLPSTQLRTGRSE